MDPSKYGRGRQLCFYLKYIGEISYSVYLIHGFTLQLRIPDTSLHIAAILGISALVSPLTYKFVELKFVAMGKDFTKKLAAPKAS